MSDNYNQDVASSIKTFFSEIGENPEKEGLLKTSKRVSKPMELLTNGN
jgi:GTP cyclohydrolase I